MKIKIAERLIPFSHANGTKFLLPRSNIVAQVFPTRIIFTDVDEKLAPFHAVIPFTGPMKEFTAALDLEKGVLKVFGKTPQGFMRYQVQAKSDGISIEFEKGDKRVLHLPVNLTIAAHEMPSERLSLGNHKAQDWEAVHRRLDCVEILPLWLRIAAWAPKKAPSAQVENFSLLRDCRQKIEACDKTKVLEAFERFFLASFEGLLVPRGADTEYQGIAQDTLPEGASPLPLLTEGAKLIRSLFIQEKEGEISILPCLPPQFHAGRMTGMQVPGGRIDVEWTKKYIRRMTLHTDVDQAMRFKFPKGVTSFRTGKNKKMFADAVFELSKGDTVQLDRFE
ncbi:MAG: hypothetical protein HYX67_13770 [Candidatus Melainabacteria bacterium]|nr:hypothetical protein [Candidatus Melainabacteria bacterium]